MGNTQSPVLAMTAIARQLLLQRFQIESLQEALSTHADTFGFCDKARFNTALDAAHITSPADVEIFELLFTMWDQHGVGKIPAKYFVVGISPLACPFDDVLGVLRFALQTSDSYGTGVARPQQLQDTLEGKYSIDALAPIFLSRNSICFHFCSHNNDRIILW